MCSVNHLYKLTGFYICVLISLVFLSCVNTLPGDEEQENTEPNIGTTAIKVTAPTLHKQIYNKDYESAIGLYVLQSSSSLNKDRYIDNAKLTCISSGFASANTLYYPASKEKCDLISYHPYQVNAIQSDSYLMEVKVETDQSGSIAYNASDFMTAQLSNLSSSTKSKVLDFEHHFSQLSIIIKCEDDTNLEQLRSLNPSVIVRNVFSEATYNFDSNEFTTLSSKVSIIPNGIWTVDNNKLVDKKCILPPQTIPSNNEFITLNIGDESYSIQLSNNFELKSGSANEITILYSAKTGVANLITQINEWREGESAEVIPIEKLQLDRLSISDFDFERSSVYRVSTGGKAIAEVCKEYLRSDELDNAAIVVYPVMDDIADLQNGILWYVIGKSNCLVGGEIIWNKLTNSLKYSGGSVTNIPFIYFNQDISINLTETNSNVKVTIDERVLNDVRGSELIQYPIIKIGTQYWMGEDLKATRYNNGTSISKKTASGYSKKTAGYFQVDSHLYYNQAAVITGKVAPYGWRIADYQDWNLLRDYLQGESSTLKALNQWESDDYESTNLTGFSARPVGLFNNVTGVEESGFSFNQRYVAYWSMGATSQTLWELAVMLSYNSNEIKNASYSEFSGYCVRCIEN